MSERFPLSHPQRRIWFSEMERPGGLQNVLALAWTCPEGVDRARLRDAWRTVTEQHDGLRLCFHRESGDAPFPVSQSVGSASGLPLGDLRCRTDEEADGWMRERAAQPFELYESPLVEAQAVKVEGRSALQLFLKVHHAVTDGASILLTLRALASALAGEPSPAVPSYRAFVEAEQSYLASTEAQEDRAFWLEATREPRERIDVGAASQGEGFDFLLLRAPESLRQGCQRFTEAYGISLYKQVLAAWVTVLARLGRNPEFGLSIANHNRWVPELRSACGMFVSTLPLGVRFDPEASFLEFADALGGQLNTLLKERSRYPFDRLVAEQRQECGLDLSVWNAISLVGHPNGPTTYRWFTMGYLPGGLALHVNPQGAFARGELQLAYAFDRSSFSRERIAALHGTLLQVLEQAHRTPECPVRALPLVSVSQKEALLAWHGPSVPYRDQSTIPEVWSEWVQRSPEKLAVIASDRSLTYRQLDERSEALASALAGRAAVAGGLVGVCLERSSDLLVALLAVLKAGAAYVPLDPEYPRERIRAMIEDCQMVAAVARPAHAELLQGLILVDPDEAPPSASWSGPPLSPSDRAYVIFTSGTTGRPKGVPIEQHQVLHLVQTLSPRFAIGPESRVVFFASLNFDASVAEIFPTLLQGGTLVVAGEPERADGAALARCLAEHRVTCATIPPSLLAVMPRVELPDLSDLVVAGESTDPAVIAWWSQGRRMINAYGPTENTVASSAGVFTSETPSNDIGSPLGNVSAYVLDPYLQLLPAGFAGELYLGGVGVSRGYLGRPELNAERFLPNPWARPEQRNPRIYKTGDLVRWRPEGRLEFLGRVDFQVKIRGHRIECQEVSTTLAGCPGVQSCVVIALPHGSTHRLVAYVVLEPGASLSASEVRQAAAQVLPAYMVPSAVVILSDFPRTPNGKIDRRALPAPQFEDAARAEYSPPTTADEQQLCTLWARLLGLERVGLDDDFFDLGGDSLLCMRMVAQAQEAGLALDVAAVREQPTVRGLCARLGSATTLPALVARSETDRFPMPVNALMMRQQLRRVLERSTGHRETLIVWDIEGPLEPRALSSAWRQLVARYDALRLRIVDLGSEVWLEEPAELPALEMEELPLEQLAPCLESWALASTESAELSGPACTWRLFRCHPEHHVLALRATHELIDAWGSDLLRRDLATLYEPASQGTEVPPDRVWQLRDFTSWYHGLLQSGFWKASEAYWSDLAAEVCPPPAVDPPSEEARQHPYRCLATSRAVRPGWREALEQRCRAERATLFEGSYALYHLLLAQTLNQETVTTACVTALRDSPELQQVVASLTNRQYQRVRLPAGAGFRQALQATQESLRQAQQHKWWPAWTVFDPEGRGLPELFFHYVPSSGPREWTLGPARCTQRPPGLPSHWPLGLAFQFLDGAQPGVLILARAGFCAPAFAEKLADGYLALLEKLSLDQL